MDFTLSDAHARWKDDVRAFADATLRPSIDALEAERRFPAEHLGPLAAKGLLAVHWPKEHGGAGKDTLGYVLALEEIARVSPAHAIVVSVHVSLVGVPILQFGSAAQKAHWLPRMAKGEALGAFALTEAHAGSDAGSLRMLARREGDGYVLNGEKVMVTNGGPAGVVLAFATVDPARGSKGMTAFLVPGDAKGITRGPRDKTMGLRAADVRTLHFENVRVPADHRLGDEGHGLKVALAGVNIGRIGVAAQATGIAAETLDRAVSWAKKRAQFGKPIAEFGSVKEMLAEMGLAATAARLLTHEAALARDRGEEFSALAARAKWNASEAAVDNASRCIQVHGGWGYDESVGVERYFRDAKVTEIYEGTSEMQKLVVTRHAVGAA